MASDNKTTNRQIDKKKDNYFVNSLSSKTLNIIVEPESARSHTGVTMIKNNIVNNYEQCGEYNQAFCTAGSASLAECVIQCVSK